MRKISLSSLSIILIALAILRVNIQDSFWKINFVVTADIIGYYEYLPATIIEHDPTLQFLKDSNVNNYKRYQFVNMVNGNLLNKFSCGVAIMQVPFFVAAHVLAPVFNMPNDGWSDIYEIMVLVSGAFYFIAGLLLLRKILLQYFSDAIVAMSLLIIYFGSNAMLYSTAQAGMSHAFSFFLFALFLWGMQKWYQQPKYLLSIIIGFTAGLIFLIRPTNAILFVLFIGYAVNNKSQIYERLFFLKKNAMHLIIMLFCSVIVMIPQWLIWKSISGNYFFYSYIGEHFFFLQPQFYSALFSYRNGWLIYSPLAFLGIMGLCALKKYAKPYATMLPIIVVMMVYVITSWWCWWYVGYGNRAFVEMQVLLAFGYASVFTWINQKSKYITYVLCAVCCFGFYLNSFQCHQYKYGLIHWDGMTSDAYHAIFLKETKPPGFDYLIQSPDYSKTMLQREPFFYR
jgi:hypothetical protein